jgi:hypothetical protein
MKSILKKVLMFAGIASISLLLVILTGCASSMGPSGGGDEGFSSGGTARLQVITDDGGGAAGSTVTIVRTIDDDGSTDVEKKYVLLTPGVHTLSCDYAELQDPGGGVSFTIGVLGHDAELIKPRQPSAIHSLNRVIVKGHFEAGKTYRIDHGTLAFRPQESSFSPAMSAMGGGLYDLTGEARLVEVK